MSLNNRVILVTGAARRIGRAIALRLNAEGARVLIHYNNSEAEARETAAQCNQAPLYRADLESVVEIRAMFESIARDHGRLDGLINNAARFTRLNVMDIEEADWDYIHSVNLKSVFFCCQAAARIMPEHGGRIVNISSLGGLRPWADHAHYCASKAGVIMLTKTLAKALAPRIAVNSVAPGVIPFSEGEEQSPQVQPMVQRTPMRRAGDAADVADAVLFFLTASDFITGQTLPVDGGLSLA
jgi:3-oxoacyl-[acyl-carrier protein] reductase/pteridine reductase